MNQEGTQELEIGWKPILRIWWSYFWRATVLGALAGFVLGALAGFLVALLGRPELGPRLGGFLGTLVQIPVSMVVLRMVLRKQYKSFSIRLISRG